jgi:hypothetical protein
VQATRLCSEMRNIDLKEDGIMEIACGGLLGL